MKYALVYIIVSFWDGSPKEVLTVSLYETESSCLFAKAELREQSNMKFICLPVAKGD